MHTRVAHIRQDALHRLTTRLARTYGIVVQRPRHQLHNRLLVCAGRDAVPRTAPRSP
ncbi:MAG: hypothetical protein OWV35_05275 [Firmicutes bacterium]|nr:hypothetical protein [Bacillota bacterium]